MIKRFFPILLAVLMLTVTAYAAEPELPDGVTITDITERQSEVSSFTLPQFYPTDIQHKNEDGIKLLLKTFEVDLEVSPDMLIENGLVQNGAEYVLRDILRKTSPNEQEKKTVSESASVSTDSDKQKDIIPLLPTRMDFTENGFTGQLTLDSDSISTEVESTEGYQYAVTDVREYPGLVRNDPYLIPKTVHKSGVTLSLCNVNWSAGSENEPSPSSYSAIASYKGSASVSKPSGYIATATYSGDVVKVTAGKLTYTLIYTEKPVPLLPEKFNILPILFGCGSVLLVGALGFMVVLLLRRRRQNSVPAFVDSAAVVQKNPMRKPKMLSELEDDDE